MVHPGEDQSTTAGQGNPTLAASGSALTLVDRLRARYEETDKPVAQKVNIMIRERKEAADRIETLENIEALARELIDTGLVNRGVDRGLVVVEKRDKSDPHYRLCIALEALAKARL